jgi:hypothetical protein
MQSQHLFEAPFVSEVSANHCSKGISTEKCMCKSCQGKMLLRSNSSYLPLLDTELNFEEPGDRSEGKGKGWRRVGPSYAVGRLPRFSGRSRSFVEKHLRSQGFRHTSPTGGSVTWIHADGSQVRIDPAHRPTNPNPNPNPNIPGNIMSHERAHYHKLWSDGFNLLSLDDRGYVVTSNSANAHVPAKQVKKQREFEFLFEEPFLSNTFEYSNLGKEWNYENQWLFETPVALRRNHYINPYLEMETSKRGVTKSSLHSIPTNNIFMHVYFKTLDPRTGYTGQDFFDWIVGPLALIDPTFQGPSPNRFQLQGININLVSNSSTAVSDFKGSLKVPGSIVVYFGHTVLGLTTTLGLAPNDPPAKKPGITCAELTKLLNTAKAKIVVLAGCATSQCVTKIKGDTVVIVTQSGKDRVTNTLQWAPAIKALLDALLAGDKVGEALTAANKSFAKASSTDSFKMINGDPTLKMI